MRILIFSDCHLTEKFEEKKFKLLTKIIENTDRVIINGDFWDGYQTTFDKFVTSKWNKLFPILKSKKTIYVLGNHDRKTYIDNRTYLFSDQSVYSYVLKLNGYKFRIEHGNVLYPAFDEKLPRIFNKYLSLIVGFFLKNFVIIRIFLKIANRKIKKKFKYNYLKDEILICGHTHYAEYDLINKFINPGSIENGIAEYLLIENGKITAKKENYL